MSRHLYAGAAELAISPPIGVELTGFVARLAPSRAVHDDLYARALARHVSAARGCPTLLCNGACGDVNLSRQGSFAIAEEMGQRLAARAPSLIDGVGDDVARLRAGWRDRRVLLGELPTLDDLSAVLEENEANLPRPPRPDDAVRRRVANAMRHWVEESRSTILDGTAPRDLAAPIQALWIGDLALLAIPGEIFARLGREMKEAAKPRPAFVSAYGNGSVGYIPTPEAYPRCEYETHSAYRYDGYPAALAPCAGEGLRDTAIDLMVATHEEA